MTGVTSIHGWPVFRALKRRLPRERLFSVRPPKMTSPGGDNVRSICISDQPALEHLRDTFKPTHIVHAAGVCDLDVCEERPRWARSLNVDGTKAVADTFGDTCHILYLSTDLVFSGDNPPAGGYTEADPPDPVSVAGKTFAEAESHIFGCPSFCIVRLGLPLGASITGTKGAIDWVRSRFERNLPVTLFHDELRSCVPTEEIADMAIRMLLAKATGLYHFGGRQPVSLYEMGRTVLEMGPYREKLLTGISRFEEKGGPPRIGDVALNSAKIRKVLGE